MNFKEFLIEWETINEKQRNFAKKDTIMKLKEMMRRPIPSQEQMMGDHLMDTIREALEEGRGLSPEVHNRVMSLDDDQFEKLVTDPGLMKAAQDEYDYAEDSGAWTALNDKVVIAALKRLGYA